MAIVHLMLGACAIPENSTPQSNEQPEHGSQVDVVVVRSSLVGYFNVVVVVVSRVEVVVGSSRSHEISKESPAGSTSDLLLWPQL